MALRPSTNTIPGSVTNLHRWRQVINHTSKEDDRETALNLFYLKDRESIAVTHENYAKWQEVQFDNQYLMKKEAYLYDYMRIVIFKEMIPNLLNITRSLCNLNYQSGANLDSMDLRLTSEDNFQATMKRFYPQPYRDRNSEVFPADPQLIYKAVREDESHILDTPIEIIQSTYDLPSLIFQLFDDNPYCHFTRQNQQKLGISDWKSRREPSRYSLRILAFIITCWPEFINKEPQSTQELIDVILMIMFNLMRRIDYYGVKEIMTTSPEHYMHTIIDRNLDSIAGLQTMYNAWELGAKYVKNRPGSPSITERYGLLNSI